MKRRSTDGELYLRLAFSALFWAFGSCFAITRRAKFMLGGDPDSTYRSNGVIHVNASGYDAIAIGCFFIALGIINLAVGIRSDKRIPVFWTGACLMLATFVYGIVQAVLSVTNFFSSLH